MLNRKVWWVGFFYLGIRKPGMQEEEKKSPFEKLSDEQLMALCIYGEARDQGLDGMLAVGSVVMNRLRRQTWMGKTVKEVILKRYQFSCFNETDPNRKLLALAADDFQGATERDGWLRAAYWVAIGILDHYLASNVAMATNYFRPSANAADPSWTKEMQFIKKIGDHFFYV